MLKHLRSSLWLLSSPASDELYLQREENSLPYFKSLVRSFGRFSWETKILLYVKSLKRCLCGTWQCLSVWFLLHFECIWASPSAAVGTSWRRGSEPFRNVCLCLHFSNLVGHKSPRQNTLKTMSLIVAERQKLPWYHWSQWLLLLMNCCLCVTALPFAVLVISCILPSFHSH